MVPVAPIMVGITFSFIFQNCLKLVYSQPANDTATNTEWQLPEVVLIQFVSPDDEHDVLETCRELYIKKNKYIERNLCVTLVIYQELFSGFDVM